MALCKILITLLSTSITWTVGNFGYNRFKALSFNEGTSGILHKPWFVDAYPANNPYKSEASQLIPHYAGRPYFYDNLKHGSDPILSIKKIPKENKDFKKAISPFYIATDNIDPKLQEIIRKTGAPYCQEVISKGESEASSKMHKKQMTCYRCKDPKNDSVYEQCSYSSKQPSSREARSNVAAEKTIDSLTAASNSRNSKKSDSTELPTEFVFSDDYFHSEPSHEVSTEYEKNIDNCERIVKNSMVCMVCKDPKTNGKYEQCSYVAQPNEKAYAYTKSSSFGGAKPKSREQEVQEKKKSKKSTKDNEKEEEEYEPEVEERQYYQDSPEELSDHSEPEQSDESAWGHDKEGHGSHYIPEHTYRYPSYSDYKGSYDSYENEEEEEDASPNQSVKSKSNCKVVNKDGETCTVCTDPKTGGASENCKYSHEPKDKFYKYSKSKSFGSPDSQRQNSDENEKAAESSEKQEKQSEGSDDDYSGYSSEPSTLDYIRSESEKISKKVKDHGDCYEEKRDSMVCTICKDPKTGGDYEQCNYSFEPEDKVYAYSKSKSFGSPTKSSKSSNDDYYGSSAEEHPEETFSLPIIYPTGTSPLDYIPKASESQSSNIYTAKKPQKLGESQEKSSNSKVDSGFYDATVRRAEIEKIVKDIDGEDRSKCKKVLKGGMTCYSCADNKGFRNEECVFVNDPEGESTKTKQYVQAIEPTVAIEATAEPIGKITTSKTTTTTTTPAPAPTTTTTTTTKTLTTKAKLLEPITSTSWTSTVTNRKTRQTNEEPKDKDEELEVLDEELDEAEPYDYVAETKPVYDKVLGLTLPAYMLEKSQHEIEFDETFERGKF